MVYVTNHNMITMAIVIFKTYKMADKGEERVLACVASLFQTSYCAKVRAEAKKRLKWEGEGRRGNACPQTPRF